MALYPANGLKADFEIAAALEPRPGAATLAPPPGCKIEVTEGPDGKFYIPAADTTTPCNVTLDIYGEEFNFKASRYRAKIAQNAKKDHAPDVPPDEGDEI